MRIAYALVFAAVAMVGCSSSDDDETPNTGPQAVCVSDADYFADELWPGVLQNKCLGCHNAQGIARSTEFVMKPAAVPGFMEANREILAYLASLERDGVSLILLKPSEQLPHGGGEVVEVGSAQYEALAAFAARVKTPVTCDEQSIDQNDPFVGVGMMSPGRTLRRATLSLAGRLPTADEYAQVDRLGETGVELVLMGLMQEPAFFDRLKELFNDVLLTDRFLGGNTMIDRIDRDRYPAYWFDATPIPGEEMAVDRERRRLRELSNNAAARSAIELIAHVVRSDRPFSEILTANYMMVNAFSARSYGVSHEAGAFPDGGARLAGRRRRRAPSGAPELRLRCRRLLGGARGLQRRRRRAACGAYEEEQQRCRRLPGGARGP